MSQCWHENPWLAMGRYGKYDEYFVHIPVNTLRPRQNGPHFPDDIFKWIFLNEIVWILISISLKFVPRGPINNIPTLVQVMAWRRPGDKPLSEPMMVSLLIHICVTRPQWVKIKIYVQYIPYIILCLIHICMYIYIYISINHHCKLHHLSTIVL